MSDPAWPDRRIRVLLVDGHPAVHEALHLLLDAQPDMEVCGLARSAQEALHLAAATRPDVAVVDVHLEARDGLAAAARLTAAGTGFPVLLFSLPGEAAYRERIRRAGASAFIEKTAPMERLLDAIRKASACASGTPREGDPALPSVSFGARP